MDTPYINIHTHRRIGVAGGTSAARAESEPPAVIEVVSVMAGRDARRMAGMATAGGEKGTGDLVGTASVSVDLPEPPFSVGIHPWQSGGDGRGDIAIEEFADAFREVETASVCAIGEIGLDYAIETDRTVQKMVFEAQLRIAAARRLPVILHCVRAFEPVMEMLAVYNLPAVVFHGFVGSSVEAARAIRAGYYLSFGERSLNSPKTVDALRVVPLERILTETDDAPVSIAEIYFRIAEILSLSVPRLREIVYANFERIVTQ